jgi:hypothetical protein
VREADEGKQIVGIDLYRRRSVLARLARGRMHAKISALEEAFSGHFTDHHRLLLSKMLPPDRRAGCRHRRA